MKAKFYFSLILISLVLPGYQVTAQTPTVQDCLGAIPITSSVYYEVNAYSGTGNYPNEIDTLISCLHSGEKNDVWYGFTAIGTGTWGFSLTPNVTSDDYDWAVFDITGYSCADIAVYGSLQVSCNYSGYPNVTGPNGLSGPQNNPMFQVVAGHHYVINVSQFSTSVNGYSITFLNPQLMFTGNTLGGTIYIDNDSDCVQSISDPGTRRSIASFNGGVFYVIPDSLGYYSAYVNAGIYILEVIPSGYYYKTCPDTIPYYVVNFPNVGLTSLANDFAVRPAAPINDLAVDLGLNYTLSGNTRITLFYQNNGTTVLSGSVHLDFDSSQIYQGGGLTPDTINPYSLAWNFNNLAPESYGIINANFSKQLPDSNPVSFYASISPLANDTTPANNIDSMIVLYGYPYDPNEKEVEPEGIIDTTQRLTYTIRFQNTGTAAAFNVIIKDSLDNNLDASGFRIESFSHACYYTLNARNLQFYFNNINLPDSGADEPGSHGFVKYSIKQKPNLGAGTSIENFASIFFDANLPIVTNTVYDTIAFPVNSISMMQSAKGELLIYPNPAGDDFNISLKGYENFKGHFILIDALGRIVNDTRIEKSEKSTISAKQISNGIYFYQLLDSASQVQTKGKLIIQK